MGFAVDHVWLVTPDGAAACETLSAATGLPVLRGWTPGGVVRSRGVRFANGPFLDVHDAPPDAVRLLPPVVLLSGALAAAEQAAVKHGWRLQLQRRSEAPAGERSPWSLGFFSRRQGVLARLGLIEYEVDPAASDVAEYAAPLLALNSAPARGARLDRVWIGAGEETAARGDLAVLGFTDSGAERASPEGRTGRVFHHPVCDLVVCSGGDGAFRLDVSNAARPGILRLGPLVVGCD